MLLREGPIMSSFKLGDWVISTKYPKVNPIKIQHQHAIDTGIFGTYTNTKGQANLLYSEECMPWQPKVDEWCWFWNKEMDVPILSKLSDITNYEDLPTIYYSEHPMYIKLGEDDNYEIVESYNFNNCEPFIGQLPTFIKDQS